jgi:large repetitive protein
MRFSPKLSRLLASFQEALASAAARKRRESGRRHPMLEILEDRSLPSAGLRLPPPPPGMGNQAVVADDWTDTDGTTPVTINVLANDAPPAGDQLLPSTVTVVAAPAHGKATVNPSTGLITYTSGPAFFSGTDTFQYTVRDNLGRTFGPGTVSVRVNRPVAGDDWIDTDATTPVSIAVLANDADPDGNSHIDPSKGTGAFLKLVSGPAHGSAVLNSDGTFTYTAAAGFTGTDRFRYTVTDDNGGASNVATVSVRVNVPTAADDLASFSGTTPVTVDVLANDQDPDGNQHLMPGSVTIVNGPQHGQVSVNPNTGQITYTAASGFNGTDTFQYTVSDDNGATSKPATVTVVGFLAGGINDAFTDTDGTTPVTIDVLANDADSFGGTLLPSSVIIVRAPLAGQATVDPSTGQITYTSGPAFFSGTDTLQYTVTDNLGHTFGLATVSIRVNHPVAADDWTDTDGMTPVTVAVLANDTDLDGNSHIDPTQRTGAMVALVSGPANGRVTLNSDGTFTYQALPGFTGTDSFRYTVTDDNGGVSNVATAFIRVNVPTAADDFARTLGAFPVAINVLANDTDPDGNQHLVPGSVTIVSAPHHGRVSVDAATGRVTYTANSGWTGTDTFQYTVSDDNGATSNPATVTVIPIGPHAINDGANHFGSPLASVAAFLVTNGPNLTHVSASPVAGQSTSTLHSGFAVNPNKTIQSTTAGPVLPDHAQRPHAFLESLGELFAQIRGIVGG